MKLDFYEDNAPDATTLLGFRHLLEKHNVQKAIFDTINTLLKDKGKILKGVGIYAARDRRDIYRSAYID